VLLLAVEVVVKVVVVLVEVLLLVHRAVSIQTHLVELEPIMVVAVAVVRVIAEVY
jgi:hypothetical protein